MRRVGLGVRGGCGRRPFSRLEEEGEATEGRGAEEALTEAVAPRARRRAGPVAPSSAAAVAKAVEVQMSTTQTRDDGTVTLEL